jgi:catechol 2,3-dioxygenase-like lactoylglutathione lyase family enzyme
MKLSQMVRAAIQVSDIAVSKKFYVDVLGFTEVYSQGTATGGNMHAFIGMPDSVVINVCILKQPKYSAFGMVGLFEAKNPEPPRLQRTSEGANLGELCMVFYCSDLDLVVEKLSGHPHSIVCAPERLRVRGYIKQREMALRGPDGEKINLIEWDPDKAKIPGLEGGRPETQKGEVETGSH